MTRKQKRYVNRQKEGKGEIVSAERNGISTQANLLGGRNCCYGSMLRRLEVDETELSDACGRLMPAANIKKKRNTLVL